MLNALIVGEISEEEFKRNYNITLLYRKLPKNVWGFTFKKKRIYVVINSSLGQKNKKLTLLHEFAHVELHHIDKEFVKAKIQGMEDEADNYIKCLLNNLNKKYASTGAFLHKGVRI